MVLKKRYPTVIKNDRVSFEESPDNDDVADPFDPGLEAVNRGYLLCRFNRTDLASDTRGAGRDEGVYPLYPEYDWRALAVWGWGHGVVLDALDQRGLADMEKVVATGHSRGGKAALCAGIYDEPEHFERLQRAVANTIRIQDELRSFPLSEDEQPLTVFRRG